MKEHYIKNDTRIFKIRTNPAKKSNFKIQKSMYRRDQMGNPITKPNGGYIKDEQEITEIVVMPGVTHVFTPPRNHDNGRLLTGLDVMVANPYKNDESFHAEWAEKIFKGKDEALLQHLLEYEHNVPFDYYTSLIPAGLLPKENRKFFQTDERFFRLDNSVTIINMANPRDRVLYYALIARDKKINPTVAASYDELINGQNTQNCRWYFIDEEEKQAVKMNKTKMRNKIIAAIEAIAEDKKERSIIDMIKVMGVQEASEQNMTAKRAYIVLNDYVEKGEEYAKLFMDNFEIWKDKIRKAEFEAYADIFDMVLFGLVRIKNGKYEVIVRDKTGNSETKLFPNRTQFAREFILDPAYKETVDDLRSSLNAARS